MPHTAVEGAIGLKSHAKFLQSREAIEAFLTHKWNRSSTIA
jgi:nuclear transport factor 2 (NTF2) superfamily protein